MCFGCAVSAELIDGLVSRDPFQPAFVLRLAEAAQPWPLRRRGGKR
jgi:hypothetical protein